MQRSKVASTGPGKHFSSCASSVHLCKAYCTVVLLSPTSEGHGMNPEGGRCSTFLVTCWDKTETVAGRWLRLRGTRQWSRQEKALAGDGGEQCKERELVAAGDLAQLQMSQSLKHCTVITSHSGVLACGLPKFGWASGVTASQSVRSQASPRHLQISNLNHLYKDRSNYIV